MDTELRPSAIGGYEDWPSYLRSYPRHLADTCPGQELADALGVPAVPAAPDVLLESQVTHDGVTTSRVSWQLGFGPRTRGWYLRPAGAAGPLPGVLALHCHGGIKSGGADRLVDGSLSLQQKFYGGRAFATWLAAQGFAVLAHDAFSWGGRRFELGAAPWRTAAAVEGRRALWREAGVVPSETEEYDAAAAAHEDTVAKAAGLLGTSFAGMVAHDDLAALNVLALLPGVDAGRLGSIGFSGGGGRSLMLAGLSPLIRSVVVACMMTAYRSLVPAYLDAHSWLLQTPGLPRLGEFPDLAARSTADRLLVQYALEDELFPEDGTRDAHAILAAHHPSGRYTGSFWPGGHTFTTDMQEEAAGFLRDSQARHPTSQKRQDGRT
ncbi:acetylesterase [Arthrobacter sp. ISL-72]|nr:acetylesterase [Arthrobacter sp. ISL-72]